MTCEEAIILISGQLDRENTPEESSALQAHLAGCGVCRQLLQELTAMEQGLAELETPPEGLREGVMDAIRAESRKRPRWHTRWAGAAVAAALVLVVGFGAVSRAAPQAEEAAAPMMARSAGPAAYAADDGVAVQSTVSAPSAQALADDRQTDVVVLSAEVPELENCPWEMLEEGAVLYTLPEADSAAELSRLYDAELCQPAGEYAGDRSYALVTANWQN